MNTYKGLVCSKKKVFNYNKKKVRVSKNTDCIPKYKREHNE